MKKHYRDENDCLNCGAELQGKFCHVCGQENLQIKENFGHLMGHAVSDYFHFDEKFFHTLVPLLFKPGKLTVDYMAGKRTQYLHPIRVYIFISLIFFLLYFSKSSEEPITTVHKKMTKTEADSIKRVVDSNKWIPEISKREISKSLDRETAVRSKKDTADDDTTIEVSPLVRYNVKKDKDSTYAQYLLTQQKLSPKDRDGFVNRLSKKKYYEWKKKGLNTKEGLSELAQHNFPKMMFLLLPMFAVLLRFTFWRNHKYYVEHLIYAFHLHCFIFLFLTILMLLKMPMPADWGAIRGWLNFFAVIAIIWYVYRSLRVIYQRSRWRTVWKMSVLSFTYTITFAICAGVFFAIVALLN